MKPALLITAGSTRNPIDSMRFISAFSSGKTGVELAGLLQETHETHLLGHPEAICRARDLPISTEVFSSTRDLMARMERWVRSNPQGTVVHAAAVGDYETDPFHGKVVSGLEEWTVRFRRTPKIAPRIREWSPAIRLVTFKAAAPQTSTAQLLRIAQRQLLNTGSHLVFANVLGRLDMDVALLTTTRQQIYSGRSEAIQALAMWISRSADQQDQHVPT